MLFRIKSIKPGILKVSGIGLVDNCGGGEGSVHTNGPYQGDPFPVPILARPDQFAAAEVIDIEDPTGILQNADKEPLFVHIIAVFGSDLVLIQFSLNL